MRKSKKTSLSAPPALAPPRYVLRLFVTSTMPSSARAIVNTRRVCEEYLAGLYELEIIDIDRFPARAASEQIITAPTLIKILPLPEQRFIGDMSQTERFLYSLGLLSKATGKPIV